MTWFKRPTADIENYKKIDKFWYPTDFYVIQSHHLLGAALQKYCKMRFVSENYDFLVAMKHFNLTKIPDIYDRFIDPAARQNINISGDSLAEINQTLDNFSMRTTFPQGYLAKKRQKHTFEKPTKLNAYNNVPAASRHVWNHKASTDMTKIYNDAVKQITDLMNTNILPDFWESDIFLDIHRWCMVKTWLKWKFSTKNQNKKRTERISDRAFQREVNNNSNTPLGQTPISQEEQDKWDAFNTYE
ncbi:MAG: hypothetical protein ACI92O_000382 [Colwellia sp.]|jgi:hypothetical protein